MIRLGLAGRIVIPLAAGPASALSAAGAAGADGAAGAAGDAGADEAGGARGEQAWPAGLADARLAEARARLAEAGLLVAGDDPLADVTACSGTACHRAVADVRAAAGPLAGHTQDALGWLRPAVRPAPGRRAGHRRRRRPLPDPRRGQAPAAGHPGRCAVSRAGDSGHGALSYEQDGAAIYRRSFAIIRAEADLSAVPADLETVAVRMIHACGMTDLPADLAWSDGVGTAGRAALAAGGPVLCDSAMVAAGITRSRLPAANQVICTLTDPRVPELAARLGTTRSAAAVELWRDHLDGAVVAVGNAPTALFRLLEILAVAGGPRPAAVIGVPVGFVGAAESKAALAASSVPHLVVRGRRGGSAMASAAVNALAGKPE